jgi:hypothetical protein
MNDLNEEPTVLDYVKSVLRGRPLPIPESEKPLEAPHTGGGVIAERQAAAQPEADVAAASAAGLTDFAFPWHALVALGLALLAQVSLEPRPNRGWAIGAFLYFLAAAWVLWAGWRRMGTHTGSRSRGGRGRRPKRLSNGQGTLRL